MASKQSLYFPDEMLREIMSESTRLDRSLSWTVQHAWRIARAELHRLSAAVEQRAPARACGREVGARIAPAERLPSRQVVEFLKGKFDRDLMQ